MDLSLHLRVLWRFKIVLAVGLFVAVFLALLAGTKASARTWKSEATLFVTQPGFPWGRTVTKYLPGDIATGKPSIPTADPQRLSSLTALYAQLATSEPVAPWLKGIERRHEQLTVTAVPAPQYSTPTLLPLLQIAATAPSQARAISLANRASSSFKTWLARQQARLTSLMPSVWSSSRSATPIRRNASAARERRCRRSFFSRSWRRPSD